MRSIRPAGTIAATTMGLGLALGYACLTLIAEQRSLLATIPYNSTFDVTQASAMLLRLEVELGLAGQASAEPDRDALSLRVALAQNQVGMLEAGEALRLVQAQPGASALVQELSAELERLALAAPDMTSADARREIGRITRFNPALAQFTARAHAISREAVRARQGAIEQTYGRIFGLLGLLVAAGFGMAALVFRRSLLQGHLARHDTLTGLANRRSFAEALGRLLHEGPGRREVAVLLLDLDLFKHVNDTMGHAAGDTLLVALADRLREVVPDATLVARLGGDEFAVILDGRDLDDRADALARRMETALARAVEIEGKSVRVTASIGIAIARPEDRDDAPDLLRYADLALYAAKGAGRGCRRVYDAGMRDRARERQDIEADLREAMRRNEFEVWYQPIVDTTTGRILSSEALLRWRHPVRGIVGPALFVPIAEEIGLIDDLGTWVIREACGAAAGWNDDVKVSVNLSARQFEVGRLLETVLGALADAGLPPHRLELEVTESVLLRETDGVAEQLGALRRAGVRIALDDFGTGYTSLSYLNRFAVDKLKIDRSFISGCVGTSRSRVIVEAICALANRLGIVTVAEGIETVEQRDVVRQAGCRQGQGYLFARPCRLEDFKALLDTRPGHEPGRADRIAA